MKEKFKSETPSNNVNKLMKEKQSQISFRKFQEDKKKSQMVIYEDNSTYIMDHKMSPFQNFSQEFNPIEQEIFNAFRKPQLQKMIIERNNQNRISKMLLDSGSPTPIVNNNTPLSQKQSPQNNMLSLTFQNSKLVRENAIDSKIYIQIENNNIKNQQFHQNNFIYNENLGIQGTKMNIQYLKASIEKQKDTFRRKPQTQSMTKRIRQICNQKNNFDERKGTFFESDKNIQTQLMPQNLCQSENSNDKNINKNERVYSQYSQQSVTGNTEKMCTPNDTKLRPNFDQSQNSLKKFRQKSSINPVKSTLNQSTQNNQVIISLRSQVQNNEEVQLKNQLIIQNPSHEQFQIVKVSEFQINLPWNIIKDKSNVPQTINLNDRNQLPNSERTNSIMSKQFKLISQNEFFNQNQNNRSRQQLLHKEQQQKIKKLVITTQSKSSSNNIADSEQNVTFQQKEETKQKDKLCLKQQVIHSPFQESEEEIFDQKEGQQPAWKNYNKYTRRLKLLRDQHDYKYQSQINKILQTKSQKEEGSKEKKENIQNSIQKEQKVQLKQYMQIKKIESPTNIISDLSTQKINENQPFNFDGVNKKKQQNPEQNKKRQKKKDNVQFKINEEQTELKNNRDTDLLIQKSSRENEGSCDLISDEDVSIQNLKQTFEIVKHFKKQISQDNPIQSYALALNKNKNQKKNLQTKIMEKSFSSSGVNSGDFPSQIINSGTFRPNNLEIEKIKDEILNDEQNVKSLQLSNLFRNQDSLNHNYGQNTPLSEKNEKQSNLSIKKFNISYNSDQKASLLASSQKKQEIYHRQKYQFWNQISNNQDLKELIAKEGYKQIKKKLKFNQQQSMSTDEQMKGQIQIRRRSKNQKQDSFVIQQKYQIDNNIAQFNSDYFQKNNQKKHLKNWYFVSSILKKQKMLENNKQSDEQVLSERNKQQVFSPQISIRNKINNISKDIQNQKIISQSSFKLKQNIKAWPQNSQVERDTGKYSQFQFPINRNEIDTNNKQFFSHRKRNHAQMSQSDKEMVQNYSNIALEGYLNNQKTKNLNTNQILQINSKSSENQIINCNNISQKDDQAYDFNHLNIRNIELTRNNANDAQQTNIDSQNSNYQQNQKYRNMFQPKKLKNKQININYKNVKGNTKQDNKLQKQSQELPNESLKHPQLNSSSACNSNQSDSNRFSSKQINKQMFQAKQFILKKQTQQQYHPKHSHVIKTQRQPLFQQFTSSNSHLKYRFKNQDLQQEWINQKKDNFQLHNISYDPVKQINTARNNQNIEEMLYNQSQYNNLKQLSFDQQQSFIDNYAKNQILTGQFEDAYTLLRLNVNKNKSNQAVLIPTISISQIKNEMSSQNNLNSTLENYPITKIISQTGRKSDLESPTLSDVKNKMLNDTEFENQYSLINRKVLSVPQKDIKLKGASFSQEQDTLSESQILTSQYLSQNIKINQNQQYQIQDAQYHKNSQEQVIFAQENSSRQEFKNQNNEVSRKKKKKKYSFKIHNLSRPLFNINSPISSDNQDFSIEQNKISFIPQNGYSDYHRYISKHNYKDKIQQIKQQRQYDPGVYQIYEKNLLDKKKEYLRIRLSQVYECLIGKNQSEAGSENTATGKTTKVGKHVNQQTDELKERIICINNSFSPLGVDRLQTDHINNQMNETFRRNKIQNVHKSNDFYRSEFITMSREFKNSDKHFTQRLQNQIEKSIQCDSTIKSLQNQGKNEQEEQEFILLQD